MVIVAALAILASNALFIVDQRETAVVRLFGQFKREVQKPGLYVKIPFFHEVLRFDRRILPLDAPAQEFLVNQLQVVIDPFARYQIEDARNVLKTVTTEENLRTQLERTVNTAVRDVMNQYRFEDILSVKRDQIMEEIRQKVDEDVKKANYGIKIIDVRIRRADFPDQINESVFNRMRTDREKVASEITGRGNAESQRIKAEADGAKVTTLANAQRDAQTLRGEGDSESIRTLADATGRDPDFYRFYRSLQAYREALTPATTTLVLSPDSDFFRYFDQLKPTTGR